MLISIYFTAKKVKWEKTNVVTTLMNTKSAFAGYKKCCQSRTRVACWVTFTQHAYGTLRVQYNIAFRVLFRLPRFYTLSK